MKEDAARPRVTPQGMDLGGTAGKGAASLRRLHRRPALGEAATQPRDGYAADMRNRSRRRAHSDQSLPRTRYGGVRVPKRRGASPRMSHLPRRLRRSSARPLDRLTQRESAYPSWTAIGRAGLDPSGRSGSGMDPPGFWGGKRWKKPETDSIITRTSERMEGFRGGLGPARSKSLAAMWQRSQHRSHALLPPDPEGADPPRPAQQLPLPQRNPRVVERLPAPAGLPLAPEAPQRLLLRGQRQSVLLQHP